MRKWRVGRIFRYLIIHWLSHHICVSSFPIRICRTDHIPRIMTNLWVPFVCYVRTAGIINIVRHHFYKIFLPDNLIDV
jgi:hypothetical protein